MRNGDLACLLILAGGFACQAEPLQDSPTRLDAGQNQPTSTVPIFKKGSLSEDARKDRIWSSMYSEHLEAMLEPALYPLAEEGNGVEAYRFIWLRSFHEPITVRIERQGEERQLTVKVATYDYGSPKNGGYAPGKIVLKTNERRVISQDEWKRLLSKFESLSFWELSPDDDVLGFDGANWVLEGVKDSKYHVVDRWSPEQREPKFREACLYFIYLSGLHVPAKEIY